MTTVQDVWIQAYTANVPNLGHDRAVLYAGHACEAFEKKFDNSYEASIARVGQPPAAVPVLKTTEEKKA